MNQTNVFPGRHATYMVGSTKPHSCRRCAAGNVGLQVRAVGLAGGWDVFSGATSLGRWSGEQLIVAIHLESLSSRFEFIASHLDHGKTQ